MNMVKFIEFMMPVVAAVLFLGGCRMVEPQGNITRVYSWGSIGNEEQAKRYAEPGYFEVFRKYCGHRAGGVKIAKK